MARMIPCDIYSGCPSPGERELFRRLREDPGTKGWTVLHSLDVAEHTRQVSGEADFVIIVPAMGVLCLEVKAHRRIRCEDGRWYYGSDQRPDLRGPFKQAAGAMYSLRRRALRQRPELRGVVFWSAVAFPYIEFRAESAEWHPWQVIDRRQLVGRPISQAIRAVLDQARHFLLADGRAPWFDPSLCEPDAQQCGAIVQVLRPDFEFFEAPEERKSRLVAEVKRYTEEQFTAVDAMEANPRVVFAGPAGTGKTILALEAARRSSGLGRRTLLLCYNRLLGGWLEQQTKSLQPEVVARTLHRHMLAVAGDSPTAEEAGTPAYWETRLPALAVERLLEQESAEHVFDELIVDEAPDVLRSDYLDFLDLSVRGGLGAGRWRMFGDFERQAIYGSANLSLAQAFEKHSGVVPVYALRVNCRNTPRIAELVHVLGGLKPRYSKVLRPDSGIDPRIHSYRDSREQTDLLVGVLKALYRDGLSGSDIAVLSSRGDDACAATRVRRGPWRDRLRPLSRATEGQIGYGSVKAYKGMEAPAIVISDVDRVTDPQSMAVFYVGITRALHQLDILVDDAVREDMLEALVATPARR